MTEFSDFLREQRGYRRVFIMEFGAWPHPCHFCGDEVDGHTVPLDSTAAVVHHVDEDRSNNSRENLVPCHKGCHDRHHHTGRVMSPESRAKLSAAIMGHPVTPEVRVKLSAANKGRPMRPQTREALRRANIGNTHTKGRSLSLEHRAAIRAANKGKVLAPTTRAKMSAAQRSRPHASCVKCHRELTVGSGLAAHLRACAA